VDSGAEDDGGRGRALLRSVALRHRSRRSILIVAVAGVITLCAMVVSLQFVRQLFIDRLVATSSGGACTQEDADELAADPLLSQPPQGSTLLPPEAHCDGGVYGRAYAVGGFRTSATPGVIESDVRVRALAAGWHWSFEPSPNPLILGSICLTRVSQGRNLEISIYGTATAAGMKPGDVWEITAIIQRDASPNDSCAH
jgi:hypothetical protein